ncbi:hypothetical protein CHN49_27280 [Pseudomonas putida]|nr:hypothetical protein CHN49_27280 [Pseudomonas putida]
MVPRVDEIPETQEERLKPYGDAHALPVGAGVPAKQATRCMAPASPVFAGKPAPTVQSRQLLEIEQDSCCHRLCVNA